MKNRIFTKTILISALFAPFAHTMKKNNAFFVYLESQDIHNAVLNGEMRLVKYLVNENAANLEIETCDKETPLHIAARHGQIKILKYLLSKDANKEAKNKCKETPLLIAVRNGNHEVVKILIAAGANVNAKNKEKKNSLHEATLKNDIKMMKILLNSFSDENQRKKYVEQPDSKFMRPLHVASRKGKEQAVELLVVKYGADIEAKAEKAKKKTEEKNQCCNSSCCCDCTADENTEELNEGGSCCTTSCCGCDCKKYGNGETPLILASMEGHKAIVLFLLQQGANVKATDYCQNTALHLTYNKEIAEILLKNKAEIEAKNNFPETPLQHSEKPEVTEILLKNGADISKALGNIQNTKCIKTLLQHGANIEAKKYGCQKDLTSLVIQCTNSMPNITIQTLIKYGSPLPEIEYDEEHNYPFSIKNNNEEEVTVIETNTGQTLQRYIAQANHFKKCCRFMHNQSDPQGNKRLLRYILKNLISSEKVPTFVKKFAMPFIIEEFCKKDGIFLRKDIIPCFGCISFDSEFLTDEKYKNTVVYAIMQNFRDINNRTILDAAIILNIPQIIPMIVELNEDTYRNNLFKAYIHFLMKGEFNPDYEKANNLIRILHNVKIMKHEEYRSIREILFKSLTCLHELRKILPDELAAKIMGYYYEDNVIPAAPNITGLN